MYFISGYSLQYKKFGKGQWEQFAFTGENNHKLSDLEHATAYLVRLKSENEFGRGIPSESLELLTEKSRLQCYCYFFLRLYRGLMLMGEQGWRSGERTRLSPLWPGFDSWTRRRMWVEFVVGFPQKPTFPNFNLIRNLRATGLSVVSSS